MWKCGVCWQRQKRGGVKFLNVFVFNLSLSFVIPVIKMNPRFLLPLNHIICKSKEL